jgi:DNA primase
VLVVEGYMDYVSLAAHGVGNAVAPLGTAMTQEQCELIARYAPRAILLYDSDKAGPQGHLSHRRRAPARRAGGARRHAAGGRGPRLARAQQGQAALRRFLDDAVDVMERKIQILERKDFFSSIKGTRQAIDSLLPTVRAASDELVRGVYIGRISEKTGVPRETLEREVARRRRAIPARPAPRAPPPRRRAPRGGLRAAARAQGHAHQRRALAPLLMVHDERWVEEAVQHVHADDLTHPLYRMIFQGLLDTEGARDAEGEWLTRFPAEAQPLMEELRADPEVATMVPAEAFFRGSVTQILERAHLERLAELNRQLNVAGPDQQMMLIREKEILIKSMRDNGYSRKMGFAQALTQNSSRYRPE